MPDISSLFSLAPFDPSHRFTTSWLIPPLPFGALRLLISIYMFTTNITRLAYAPESAGKHWSYFTNITYWTGAFYFLFAAFHTIAYSRGGSAPLKSWGKGAQAAHGVLWSTWVVFALLVTIVYWAILAPSESPFTTTFTSWSNISVHALNSLFAIFEVIFSRVEPPPWIHIVFVVLFLALYLALAYVTYATQGWYPYDFLDPADGTGKLVGYVFGILVAGLVVFVAVWVVVWARVRVTERVLGSEKKMRKERDEKWRTAKGGREVGEAMV